MDAFNVKKGDHIEIDHKLIGQLMRNWPKRSSVRGCYFDELKKQKDYNPIISDYPTDMVPFWNHPTFQKIAKSYFEYLQSARDYSDISEKAYFDIR